MSGSTPCDSCAYYAYDEQYQDYYCTMDMDEDEFTRIRENRYQCCPYWRDGDEYRIARKQ